MGALVTEQRARDGATRRIKRKSNISQSINSPLCSPEPTMQTFGLSIRIVAWSMRSCSVSGRCVYIFARKDGEERDGGEKERKKRERGRLLFFFFLVRAKS